MKPPLPIVEGVGPSSQWLPPGRWKTIVDFLTERYPGVNTATWASRMEKGKVVDETGSRLTIESRYRAGACIFYYRELDTEKRIPFLERVIYQDEHILVVDKPHFLPVVPSGRFLHETLLVRLKKQGNLDSLVPIHRLDRETAGVVLLSLNPETRGRYTEIFRERRVKKVYEALAPTICVGPPRSSFPMTRRSRIVPGDPFFRMKEVEGESNSETYIDVLNQLRPAQQVESIAGVTLYQLIPVTGRKHQLRLHLASLGIPIINDRHYPEIRGAGDVDSEEDFSNPLKLLARSICFKDPLTGQVHYFESSRRL